MGLLGLPTRNNKNNEGYARRYKNYNYSNLDAVSNVIHYVTRTRYDEDRADELLGYGAAGAGYYLSADDIIQQFLFVQNVFHINQRGGKRMYHEVYNLLDEEVERLEYNPAELWYLGMECCQVYYQMGFQVVFAIHFDYGKRYHIHFAVNSINFITGLKWHTSLPEIKQREAVFNQILGERQRLVSEHRSAIIFFDEGEQLPI